MPNHKKIELTNVTIGNDCPLTLIAGPCQLESLEHSLMIATKLQGICKTLGLGFVFKGSFDKANRTSLSGKRGLGIEKGLEVMEDVRNQLGCATLTDIHTADQCALVAKSVDIIQIPAFLSRQTDLLIAAGESGAAINVKKGQFLAPWDMQNVVDKILSTGNDKIMQCERGVSFGYNTLIADMRSLPIMAQNGFPVVMDATHSVQQPGGKGGSSGGQREFAPVMARAAASLGVASIFIETHEDPDHAPSDGPNMIHLSDMENLLGILAKLDKIAKENPVSI